MIVLRLALRSLWNRRTTAFLTVLCIAISVLLLLGVEKIRVGARESFAGTVSGTDLVMGARTGGVQLLLYSVFRIGDATNNVTWKSYQDIAKRPEVDWIIPISLGDSHRGFRVMGTENAYFEHYKYRNGRSLGFAAGGPLNDLFDAVVGADVAESLGYRLGDSIIVSHGVGGSLAQHDDKPFRVAGILAKTGTPVDRTVHVSLEAIEAIHIDWQSGARIPGQEVSADEVRRMDMTPHAVTAALIGLKSRLNTFSLQRWINEYPEEPLSAVLPGVALLELWSIVGAAETALLAVSAIVVLTAILGMIAMIFSTLSERRREMAILRSVGARPIHIFLLMIAEAGTLSLAGTVLGIALVYAVLAVAQPMIEQRFGLYLPLTGLSPSEMAYIAAVIVAGLLAGTLPAIRAYLNSVADGVVVRI